MDQQTGGIVGENQNGDGVCFLAAHRRVWFDAVNVALGLVFPRPPSQVQRRVKVALHPPEQIQRRCDRGIPVGEATWQSEVPEIDITTSSDSTIMLRICSKPAKRVASQGFSAKIPPDSSFHQGSVRVHYH
ncbi:MAG: hypothetical protein WKF77_09890 [Planctomycetaceae bacterium]